MREKINQFVNFITLPERINYGLNIYFLDTMIQKYLLWFTNEITFRELIEEKRALLSKVNPLDFFDTKKCLVIDSYLDVIDEEGDLAPSENFEELFVTKINIDALETEAHKLGQLMAFTFDLNIERGHRDYAKKKAIFSDNGQPLKGETYKRFLQQADHIKEGTSWPYTQLWHQPKGAENKEMLPFFAFTGFSEQRILDYQVPDFEATGFFFEIIENNIECMVALGLLGPENQTKYDFPPYFLIPGTYTKKDENGLVLRKVVVTPKPGSLFCGNIVEHHLELQLEVYEPQTHTYSNKAHYLTVFNVPIKDGSPLNLDLANSLTFFNMLLEKARSGIKIGGHCRAGRGRTGQLFMTLIALYTGRAEQIMQGNPMEEFRGYVLELYGQRAGMPLEWAQIFQSVETICYILAQKPKRKLDQVPEELPKPPKIDSISKGSSSTFFSTADVSTPKSKGEATALQP